MSSLDVDVSGVGTTYLSAIDSRISPKANSLNGSVTKSCLLYSDAMFGECGVLEGGELRFGKRAERRDTRCKREIAINLSHIISWL